MTKFNKGGIMRKTLLVSLIAVFAILALASFALASEDLDVTLNSVSINGIELSSGSSATVSGFAGETIPVKVVFTSNVDSTDTTVKVWIDGYRDTLSSATSRMNLINGSIYVKYLTLKLPTDIDLVEDFTLYVRVGDKVNHIEDEFNIKMQRDSYNLGILDVFADRTVSAGDNIPVDVVLKNSGFERLDDVFVVASISSLGVEKRAYFGDLTPTDESDPDKSDSESGRLYLNIPSSAETGVYTLQVDAYNGDAKISKTVNISVTAEKGASVFAPIRSKEISVGSTSSYDLTIVNFGSKVAVYELVPEASESVTVNVPQVITVPAGSSQTVSVNVKALKEGTNGFAVNVNSANQLVQRVAFTAVSEGKAFTSSVVVLTIVLAVIFVVLLVVLIVLLTRKPGRSEELEETYY